MFITVLAAVVCLLAVIPALVCHRNLRAYIPSPWPKLHPETPAPHVSVLIPARNEEASIRAAVEAALASEQVGLEVIVLDDHSTDTTAAIVRDIAVRDRRVRLVAAPPLPPGWCGKQHACMVLARHASSPLLTFVDADVRLAPEGLARLVAFLETSSADLVSGVPYQETGTFFERLLIPQIHFLLLAFLPFWRMRTSRHPAYGVGCGQLFMARRDAYETVGGHAAIRASLHDGLHLPRAFRAAGLTTDLCDATSIATCRMYHNARAVWHGFAKNATQGLAAPRTIVPATVLLLAGQVGALGLLGLGAMGLLSPVAYALAGVGTLAAYYPRVQAVRHFDQPWIEACLHPLSILVLLAIQWYACGRALLGLPATWKGRNYTPCEAGLSPESHG